jgi:hypothetical protein
MVAALSDSVACKVKSWLSQIIFPSMIQWLNTSMIQQLNGLCLIGYNYFGCSLFVRFIVLLS